MSWLICVYFCPSLSASFIPTHAELQINPLLIFHKCFFSMLVLSKCFCSRCVAAKLHAIKKTLAFIFHAAGDKCRQELQRSGWCICGLIMYLLSLDFWHTAVMKLVKCVLLRGKWRCPAMHTGCALIACKRAERNLQAIFAPNRCRTQCTWVIEHKHG